VGYLSQATSERRRRAKRRRTPRAAAATSMALTEFARQLIKRGDCDLRVNEYAALDQPSQHYQHCRQTQNCHCEKYHRVGRHLCQKLDHLPPPSDLGRSIGVQKRSVRVGSTGDLGRGSAQEWPLG
jgi:hypothetical protein